MFKNSKIKMYILRKMSLNRPYSLPTLLQISKGSTNGTNTLSSSEVMSVMNLFYRLGFVSREGKTRKTTWKKEIEYSEEEIRFRLGL